MENENRILILVRPCKSVNHKDRRESFTIDSARMMRAFKRGPQKQRMLHRTVDDTISKMMFW